MDYTTVVRVGIQGVQGAYSDQAVNELFSLKQKVQTLTTELHITESFNNESSISNHLHYKVNGYPSFESVFSALNENQIDFALVPIENSLGGTVHVTYDLLLDEGWFAEPKTIILGEVVLKISHCLLAAYGVNVSDITHVFSHPQALSQCKTYIKNVLKAIAVPTYDTAGSAKMVHDRATTISSSLTSISHETKCCIENLHAELNTHLGETVQIGHIGIIASQQAAHVYNLNILETNIEDVKWNYTRFLVIAKRPKDFIWSTIMKQLSPPQQQTMKTTISFTTRDDGKAGTLNTCLSVFSMRNINITKVESRPLPAPALIKHKVLFHDDTRHYNDMNNRNPLDYLNNEILCSKSEISPNIECFHVIFFLDVIGSIMDLPIKKALEDLTEFCPHVNVLGSYPVDCQTIESRICLNTFICHYYAMTICHNKFLSSKEQSLFQENDALDEEESFRKKKKFQPSSVYTYETQRTIKIPLPFLRHQFSVGIVGLGTFGQFLSKRFLSRNHPVFGTSYTDYKENDFVKYSGIQFFPNLDIQSLIENGTKYIILAISIRSFEKVLLNIPKYLSDDIVIIDVLSVKSYPKTTLLKSLPPNCNILCCHPMFGPDSGSGSWENLPFVYEKVRVKEQQGLTTINNFLNFFSEEGCRMIEMSCETHDKFAATSQFVTHLTGRVLQRQNLTATPIDTQSFRDLLHVVETTTNDSFDLFTGLYEYNPNSETQLHSFSTALQDITCRLHQETMKKQRNIQLNNINAQPNSSALMSQHVVPNLSQFLSRLSQSATSKVLDIALKKQSQGQDVYFLCIGMPDYPPPPCVMTTTIEEINKDTLYKYTSTIGLYELRNAISKDIVKRHGVLYNPNEICICSGAKQAIFQSILALCQEGDEIVIPLPCWPSYKDIACLSGAVPITLPLSSDNGFRFTTQSLASVLTVKTKLIIICNPSNPTVGNNAFEGVIIPKDELLNITNLLKRPEYEHVIILVDEIYDRLVYDDNEFTSFITMPNMKDRILYINGFSKTFSMCGYRIGYIATTYPKVIQAVVQLQSQINTCAAHVSQKVAIAILNDPTMDQWILNRVAELQKKRNFAFKTLNAIQGIHCYLPEATFYLMVDIRDLFSFQKECLIKTSNDFCNQLLEQQGVALVSGDSLGCSGFVRIVFAISFPILEDALLRFKAFVVSLQRKNIL